MTRKELLDALIELERAMVKPWTTILSTTLSIRQKTENGRTFTMLFSLNNPMTWVCQ